MTRRATALKNVLKIKKIIHLFEQRLTSGDCLVAIESTFEGDILESGADSCIAESPVLF